jgi:hypothetical protein
MCAGRQMVNKSRDWMQMFAVVNRATAEPRVENFLFGIIHCVERQRPCLKTVLYFIDIRIDERAIFLFGCTPAVPHKNMSESTLRGAGWCWVLVLEYTKPASRLFVK